MSTEIQRLTNPELDASGRKNSWKPIEDGPTYDANEYTDSLKSLLQVCDELFGIRSGTQVHVNTTYCPDDTSPLLTKIHEEVFQPDVLNGSISESTGKTEFDIRRLIIDKTDYSPLNRLRIIPYLSFPRNGIEIEDFDFNHLATQIRIGERFKNVSGVSIDGHLQRIDSEVVKNV